MITYKQFIFNAFQENTYVVFNQAKKAFILDPGCNSKQEQHQIAAYIEQNQLSIEAVINTHCHIDHILGNFWACKTYKAPLLAHALELENLRMAPMVSQMYGIQYETSVEPSAFLEPQNAFFLGDDAFEILFTPGHSAGSISLYYPQAGVAFVGDALFAGSIGRTDLPGGDYQTLIKSIKNQLLSLPANTIVFSGHGPATTIENEAKSNPFLR